MKSLSSGLARLRRELNRAQFEAVTTTEGPLLVLAGAGTGKTRVITYRVAHLLENGIEPGDVLAVTFTNKAAREMRERVRQLLGRSPKGLTLSTFHSLGVRILRAEADAAGLRSGFTIYDSADQLSLIRGILRDIRGAVTSGDVRSAQSAISLAKNRFEEPDDMLEAAEDDWDLLVARVFHRYEEQLRAMNAVDFDDLIRLPVRAFQVSEALAETYRHRFRYIMVDEYQDTNGSQYRFTRSLVGPERNICVVGDDDQSIYGFRGAEMDKILKFERDFPGARVVKLEENYRSSGSILNLANAVIAGNRERHAKILRSTLGPGEPVDWIQAPDDSGEVDSVLLRIQELRRRERVRYEDMVILLRSAFQARPFEEKLRLRQIPYTLVGGQSYFDRREIRDVLAYWKLIENPDDDVSLLRIINSPKRGMGPSTISRLDSFARSRGLSVLEGLARVAGGEGDFKPRARRAASSLGGAFEAARARLRSGDIEGTCRTILEEVCYKEFLHELYPDPLTFQARWAAVEELLQFVRGWHRENPGEPFSRFMEALTLDNEEGARDDVEKRRGITLMTLHSAKGLEFPVAFLVGVEEDLLPHRKSVEQGDRAVEEERRLFYVGITRARRRLILTSAGERVTYGRATPRLPSRFLTEIGDRNLVVPDIYDPEARPSSDRIQDFISQYRSRLQGGDSPDRDPGS